MILDVGCGSSPHGDVNVDAMIEGDECGRQANIKLIPNFVKADAAYLPFKDKSFDEVFSSHMMEHVKDEKAVLREMQRVSKATIRIIVPVEFIWLIYDFLHPKKFFWSRKHHKRSYGLNPFKAKNVRLRFIDLEGLIQWKISFDGRFKLPIPLETETVFHFKDSPILATSTNPM